MTANNAGRILVVDDQPANLRVVSALLLRHGYEVDNAADGPTALALCEQRAPDLVLLDMMMPGMDGFGLIGELKQREQLLRIPVVFLTAAHDRDLLLRAFDAGAVDYVTKPFTPEELLARVSAHIGLKLTRDRLERVAQERQELVNLVAHDLKNPLSSVLFASDLLLSRGCKPERVTHYLQMIRESADDALGYIHRYLEMQSAAHQARQSDTDMPLCGLRETLQWLERRYGMQLEAREMRLLVRMPNDEVRVAIDGLVLRQVAENLVSNAIKYAQDGHELELSVRHGAQGYWQLVAQDRGPGISEHRQRDLFKPFVRLGGNSAADPMSSGLGLSLARQIIADVGGHLWYEDREGGGARFIIELPEARAVA
ncbi:hybrid sensor histidine kinase/response regulator [Luteimonas cucumeris]|uniref:hybrid sensor histidine kinase/response regulator n=1 Tax=Luteimonas cucumeris TaxID=985012 RepID=UPI00131514E3|nr:hybrid sensor histidine kinase/response regulator [Luteimonas cucumeris]